MPTYQKLIFPNKGSNIIDETQYRSLLYAHKDRIENYVPAQVARHNLT